MVKHTVSRLECRLEPTVAEGLTLSLHQTPDGDVAEIELPNVITIQLTQFVGNDYAEMMITTSREVFNKCFLDVDKAAALIHKKITIAMRPPKNPDLIPEYRPVKPMDGSYAAINGVLAQQLPLQLEHSPTAAPNFDKDDVAALNTKMAELLKKSKENK